MSDYLKEYDYHNIEIQSEQPPHRSYGSFKISDSWNETMMRCVICHEENEGYKIMEIGELIRFLSNHTQTHNKDSTIKQLSTLVSESIKVNICDICSRMRCLQL
jgi:hypothetical protein